MSKLFAFMGPSGGGKSTIQHSLPMRFLTHYVTREVREGEVDGYHIKHVTVREFETGFRSGEIATRTEYAGNLYGAPVFAIEDIKNGIPYHATATIESVRQFKELLGDENVIVIYIAPPSIEVVRQRMINRGDKPENVEKRIEHIYSAQELENEQFADYGVINDNLDTAIEAVLHIIKHELEGEIK